MIPIQTDTARNFESHVATSITNFFVSTVGGNPCNFEDRPQEGFVHVHFSNSALTAPLSFAFTKEQVGDIVRACQTLLMIEPLAPSMRLELHQPGGPESRGHLDFLQASFTSQPSDELLKPEHPRRPIDLLRERLSGFATEFERGIPLGVNAPQTVKASIEQLLYDVVARYYAVVDRASKQDLAEVVSMFAQEGVYDRAGKILSGQREIEDFYTSKRTLEGQHQVHSLVVNNLLVFVTGVFEGRSIANSEPRRLEFTDT